MNIINLSLTPLAVALLFSACTTRKMARYDAFDQAEVSHVKGNYVSGRFFGKTVLALNPRVESRLVESLTNIVTEWKTNIVVTRVTNLVVTLSTNQATAISTNDLPPVPAQPTEDDLEMAGNAVAEAGITDAPTNTVATASIQTEPLTNITASTGMIMSSIASPGGTTESAQRVDGLNRQISVITNNQMITTQFNQLVTLETNSTVTILTNQMVEAVTNITVLDTNIIERDFYLVTELISPPEFVLAPPESLVILIDGERRAFSPTNSTAAFVGRRGFTSTLYPVPADTFEKIAEAKEVRMRLRGVNSVIDLEVPRSAKQDFAQFVQQLENPEVATAAARPKRIESPRARARR